MYVRVAQQMSFYLSDANLAKSKFLQTELSKSVDPPWIPLDVFMKFNKLRGILEEAFGRTELQDLCKSLRSCPESGLQVKEDDDNGGGPKWVVKRTKPYVEKTNTDECTIYVQNIPSGSDQDTLAKTFAVYGTVEYVSLPKYTTSQQLKGRSLVTHRLGGLGSFLTKILSL